MQKITANTKDTALDVLTKSFESNPGALWVIKKDAKIKERLKALCAFCLEVSIQKKGAYISSDKNGVALIFKNTQKQKPLKWLLGYIKLGNKCIGWDRALSMIKREKRIQRTRPKEEHLYFWMLAVEDNRFGLSTLIEMRDFAFDLSKSTSLPIYAETTLPRNKIIYERYGFRLYHTWEIPDENLTIWFLVRDVP